MRISFTPVSAMMLLVSSLCAQSTPTALVRRAPTLNGNVEGSIQVMTAESVTLNGSANVMGDLLIPGLPTIQLNGNPTYVGTVDGTGVATPTSHRVTINGGARLGYVVRRTDAVALPTVTAPPPPSGTRNVSLNSSSDLPGNFATLRNLTLNGNIGAITVPPGTYGAIKRGRGLGFGVGGAETEK